MGIMRNAALLGLRLTLGSYLAAHGAQKLFGAFGGRGLAASGAGFERVGLSPGRPMARLAGTSELVGGVLTAAGLADPIGPLAIAGTMAVASTTHRGKGPFNAQGGWELPLTNVAAAAVLAAAGPGRYSLNAALGLRVPRPLVRLAVAGAATASATLIFHLLSAARQRQAQPEAAPAADERPARLETATAGERPAAAAR
jgi:putative oxidoreductase